MKTSFLEYYQQILDKVSFDYQLLKKEYHKAIKHLNDYEAKMLNSWLDKKGLYPMEIPEDDYRQ